MNIRILTIIYAYMELLSDLITRLNIDVLEHVDLREHRFVLEYVGHARFSREKYSLLNMLAPNL